MYNRFTISDSEKNEIRKMYLSEQSKEKKDEKKFCHQGNTKSLDDLIGDEESTNEYVKGISLRENGINGIIDKIELLKTLRLHPDIKDGGENLAHSIMTDLKAFKPYNYYDETRGECLRAIDKMVELYKENVYGEELVKDIEKVYVMAHISARAKEFLKRCLDIIKEK